MHRAFSGDIKYEQKGDSDLLSHDDLVSEVIST